MSKEEKFMLPVNILRILSEYGGKSRIDEMTEKLQCDEAFMSEVIDDLANEGYVIRKKNTIELRVNRVVARW